MTNCVRRVNSVWTTCKCPSCTLDRNKKSKLHRAGLYNRVSSDAAWEVVHEKRAAGWSVSAIASASGTTDRSIQSALDELNHNGRQSTFGPRTARLLVNIGDPTTGAIGVVGTRRRLRGLARQGYTLQMISAGTGIGFSTLAAIRNDSTTRVAVRFWLAIRDYTDRVVRNPGPSVAARTHAERQRWHSLLSWDDIDDPNSRPSHTRERTKHTVDPIVVERVLSGDIPAHITIAEKREVVRRWLEQDRMLADLERWTGWNAGRYVTADAGRVCACGCGDAVSKRRQFAAGHAMRGAA